MAKKLFELSGGVWREKRKYRTGFLSKLILISVLGCMVWSWGRPAPLNPIVLVTAEKKDLPVWLKAVGNVQAAHSAIVHSQISGMITEIGFQEGEHVHKGDVLARIDATLYRAQLAQAIANKEQDEVQVQAAHAQLKQLGATSKSPSPKQQALITAIHQFDAAIKSDIATIDQAQALLDYTTITAPMDGRAGIKHADVGSVINSSDKDGLVEITQMNPVSVVFGVPDQNLPDLANQLASKKSIVVVARDMNTGSVLEEGLLEMTDNQVNPTTGTLSMKATFSNDQHRLWPGAMVAVQVSLGTLSDVVVVPLAALITHGEESYVYKVDNTNKTVTPRPVKLLMKQGEEAAITGLGQGEQLAIQPSTMQIANRQQQQLGRLAPAR